MRIAKGGESIVVSSFLLGFLLLAASLLYADLVPLSAIYFILLIFIVYFFRDPDREIGDGLVSPADGRIMKIVEINDEEMGRCLRISIFMSILDVHVNRMPIDGRVIKIHREKGSFYPAYLDKSDKNEKNIITIETDIGVIKLVQIVGVIARRIVCYLEEGIKVNKGDRIGMIRFGSRVDVILPKGRINLKIKEGDRVRAGVDSIASINP